MKGIIFISVLSFATQLHNQDVHFNFIIWNVGQGSWTTWIDKNFCHHVDMGGEFFPKEVLSLCSHRNNRLSVTHFDWDHVSFIKKFSKQVSQFCLTQRPQLSQKSSYKTWFQQLPICSNMNSQPVYKIYQPLYFKNKNQSSLIYSVADRVLITGDSPRSEERKWAYKIPKNIKVLILGHHGSHTSTSKWLLNHGFKFAIASSRREKFGHPHKRTRELLKRFKVPLLTTQDWGHIYLEL